MITTIQSLIARELRATSGKKHERKITVKEQDYADQILAACEPSKMSSKQALDFLEEISSILEGHIEALREEIGEDL